MGRYPNEPSGHVRATPLGGRELVIERSFPVAITDVWACFTEPERFARWYGAMVGEPGPGRTIAVTMTAEDQVAQQPVKIVSCDPPNSFVVDFGDQGVPWHLSVDLVAHDGGTQMTFVHAMADELDPTEIGPGWEFYADSLAASMDDVEMPDWERDGYLAALGPHYGAPA